MKKTFDPATGIKKEQSNRTAAIVFAVVFAVLAALIAAALFLNGAMDKVGGEIGKALAAIANIFYGLGAYGTLIGIAVVVILLVLMVVCAVASTKALNRIRAYEGQISAAKAREAAKIAKAEQAQLKRGDVILGFMDLAGRLYNRK